MKLIGSGNGKRAASGKRAATNNTVSQSPAAARTNAQDRQPGTKKKMTRKKAIIIMVSVILGTVLLLAAGTYIVWRNQVQPFFDMLFPKMDDSRYGEMRQGEGTDFDPENPDNTGLDDQGNPRVPGDPSLPIHELRDLDKYTILILGIDGYKGMRSEGGGNTDVIMIVSFDTNDYKIEVVSIPRDTIVNVSWNVKKINSIYAAMLNRHGGKDNRIELAMNDTKEYFADFLGFSVDFWVTVNMDGFEALINSLPGGGVRFNVQHELHMQEPDIGMDITLYPGEQTLNGMQALAIVRDRELGGDFGRIKAQQQLLQAIAGQVLSNRGSFDLLQYFSIFLRHGNTDMDPALMARISSDILKVSGENINFTTAPGETTTVGDGSYVYVHLDEWLEIVNERISPFYEQITPSHVSILTRGENGRFYVTDDNYKGSRSWGN